MSKAQAGSIGCRQLQSCRVHKQAVPKCCCAGRFGPLCGETEGAIERELAAQHVLAKRAEGGF
eukprot:3204633-Amphidinium_carterae.1